MRLHLGPRVGVVVHRGIYRPPPGPALLAVTAAVDLAQLPQQWSLPPGSGFGSWSVCSMGAGAGAGVGAVLAWARLPRQRAY